MKNILTEDVFTSNSEPQEVYDQFLLGSQEGSIGRLHVTHVKETARDTRRGCRIVVIVTLVTSVLINVILTPLLVLYLMFPSNTNLRPENWPSVTEETARETTAGQKQLCVPCGDVTISGHPGICCQQSHDSALLLIKLLLNQKKKKNHSLLYGQYHLLSNPGKNQVALKSYQEKIPRSFSLPASSNRIQVTASGYYSIYSSMCFSGREFRGDSISLNIKLEQVRGGSKRTLIQRAATVHWHPNSFVNVHFMENVWLNKTTELLLFISHPNLLYSFPDCNILTLLRTK